MLVVVLAVVVGCGKKTKDSPFDRDVTIPLIDSNLRQDPGASGPMLRTDFCYPDPNGSYGDAVKYTDKVSLSRGHDDGKDFNWGFGGGRVNRPIREVWAVLHNQAVMVWSGVSTSSYAVQSPPGGTTHYYQVNYHVDNGFPLPSVDWQMDWYHSLSGGDAREPQKIVINYRKVKGTKYIEYWEGSIVLDFITPTLTAIAGRDQIKASRTSADDAAGSVQDIVTKARDREPNWSAIGGR
jgi:hypothetical protein